MKISEVEKIWQSGLLNEAFNEHKDCIKEIYAHANEILVSPPCAHPGFKVQMGEIPPEYFSLRKNIFSTLFQSVYQLLSINKKRRLLYGQLNHLFRIWVTSADNLLDNEDKTVVPIIMPGESRIMRQVISTMLADRIMKRIFETAVEKAIISQEDSKILSDMSLQILLPSAAEEASEENGITERPEPEYVLHTIHRLKTGILFHVPFLGPEHVESDINIDTFNICKDALDKFGLGCQLLDDIRDMGRDYIEKRHNYILSKIYWEGGDFDITDLENLEGKIDISANIFPYFLKFVNPTVELAKNLLQEGLFILSEVGLGLDENAIKKMVFSMFGLLDVGELDKCLNGQKILA